MSLSVVTSSTGTVLMQVNGNKNSDGKSDLSIKFIPPEDLKGNEFSNLVKQRRIVVLRKSNSILNGKEIELPTYFLHINWKEASNNLPTPNHIVLLGNDECYRHLLLKYGVLKKSAPNTNNK